MIKTISLLPGITLRCFQDTRFKQSCLTVQFVRPMCREEAACNALIPAVLLRGCEGTPDLRDITLKLDDLYGASVGALVRRVGDYQTTGLHCSFIEDAYALDGDKILEPMVAFLGKLLFAPVLEKGAFRKDYVNNEKKNQIAAIASLRNDKRVYAANQLLSKMCKGDAYGIPRLGEIADVKQLTPKKVYNHYLRVIKESPIEIFYVGSKEPEEIVRLMKGLFAGTKRDYVNLHPQTDFSAPATGEHNESMDVAQGKLAMGFVTPITYRNGDLAAMQVCNALFGGGMTSKLFTEVREKNSLCYDIGSAYYGSKGILTVSAGIDCDKKDLVQTKILQQLNACCNGEIEEWELTAAKRSLISGLRAMHDSAGSIESFYATGALSGQKMTPEEYSCAIEAVTKEQVASAARSLKMHTVFFLRGEM